MPLTEADFLDFIYNYFKAEYAPIRSFWSTATADPRQPSRWYNMGHELSPRAIRPANAQAQKDLDSLDFLMRKWNLDAAFIRGLVLRFAKYEVHDRLEKKLYENARLDLMVRKALKEKHLIDALWPSPAPRNLSQDLLQQSVQVRRWYGDMFNKYFRVLHSIDEFELRPEVDLRIKNSRMLMLIPFVDHLIFGAVDPIIPIIAKGAGYSNAKDWAKRDGTSKSDGFGEPEKFDIRFDAPAEVHDTYTKTVQRQAHCNKCSTKRDVQVVISVDPNLSGVGASSGTRKPSASSVSGQRRQTSKTAQRYAPGYKMPGYTRNGPLKPGERPEQFTEEAAPAPAQEKKKQCPRCTFLNHAELTACEMCQADLPDATVQKPPSPAAVKSSHSHSASHPPPSKPAPKVNDSLTAERPGAPNRHSLSSSLLSIFPFNQQQQQKQEHHAKAPSTQQTDVASASPQQRREARLIRPSSKDEPKPEPQPSSSPQPAEPHKPSTPPNLIETESEIQLSGAPEMTMMPVTPPPTSTSKRPAPAGLPSNLMDDFVPVSPAFPSKEDEEDAGWGEMSRGEAHDSDSDEEEYEGRTSGGLVDLDAVAREEADVWGEREDE